MINGSSFFSGIQCPFGANCQRPYCQFQHPRAPINNSTPIKDETQQNWNLSTNSNVIISSTSNSNTAIISQEEQSDFQGYVGYVGSASVSTNLNGSKAVTYAQEEPSTYGPIYGQQIFGERISGLTYSQEYVYPTLQTSASVYAPEDPGSFNSIPALNYQKSQQRVHKPNSNIPPLMSLFPLSNNVQNKFLNVDTSSNSFYEPTNSTSHEPSNSPIASFSPPPLEEAVLDRKQHLRANFSPFESAIPLGNTTKKMSQKNNVHSIICRNSGSTTITNVSANSDVPAYIPTPIAVLERQKKEKKFESRIIEKRKNSESDEFLSTKKNYNIPMDLADDEILNPNKGSLISIKRSKASVPNKKLKLDKDTISKIKNKSVNSIRINGPLKTIKVDRNPLTLKVKKETDSKQDANVIKKSLFDSAGGELKKPNINAFTGTKLNKLEELNRRTKFIAEMDKQIAEKELALKMTKNKSLVVSDKKSIKKKPESFKNELTTNGTYFSIDDLFNDDDKLIVNNLKEKEVKAKINPVASTSLNDNKGITSSAITPESNLTSKVRLKNAVDQMKNRYEKTQNIFLKENTIKEKIFNKGEVRAARTGSQNIKKLIPTDIYNKTVPYSLRVKLLERIHDEYLKIGMGEESVDKAIEEEKAILYKVSTKSGYMSAMTNLIKQIRNFVSMEKGASSVSHNDVLTGRHSGTFTVGFQRDKKKGFSKLDHISESDFYNELNESYLLNEENLFDNGYPRWVDPSTKQRAWIKLPDSGSKSIFVEDSNLKRICSRCGTEYRLTIEGDYSTGDNSCTFHWGKAWKKRINGTVDSRYTCCNEDLSVKGCSLWKLHVTESLRQSELKNFKETPRPFGIGDPRSRKVYAMDCEMIYTSWGPALARVSVVDLLDDLVLDVIVKPEAMIVDCNTRFSGLTLENIENANSDLNEARERLFELVNSETILIGHSLESDLKAMRIVHKKIVDTSVVFPHRLGPPKKRALKTLSSEILQKIIQEEEGGHDSKEDASCCMKLMLHKIREAKS